MDEQEEVQQNNMISNLPLLFANGYPTSLEKISESQLQKFIPFMVQCSLGHINLQGKIDNSEPEWWPEDLPFVVPFTKPKKFNGNWMEKMKEVVVICYTFHRSIFLLRFCTDLASYEHASLRFINNYNSTTSLFDRRSNKLLVTFRNENMSYDQPMKSRKCLLQRKAKYGRQAEPEVQHMMVEPAPFDIYLCDNCDAELYSKEAITEHEKTCTIENDVILCDTPEPHDDCQEIESPTKAENDELRIGFLQNFNLSYLGDVSKTHTAGTADGAMESKPEDTGFMIVDRNKRVPRRNRAVHSLTRCPTIPLSSPAGQMLLRTTKAAVPEEYLTERLDRMERFCHAPCLANIISKPKYLERKTAPNNIHCTFKKPNDYNVRVYNFPRRQHSQRRNANTSFLNQYLIRRCRPISVRLRKITDKEIKTKQNPASSQKINIKLTRDTARSSSWKISQPSTEVIVDTIDLCSSDDDDNKGEITKPRFSSSLTESSTVIQQVKSKVSSSVTKSTITSSVTKRTYAQANATTILTKARDSPTKLKRISKSLNASDVSLIPVRRAQLANNCTLSYDKTFSGMTPSVFKIVPSSLLEENAVALSANANNHNNNTLYENNILIPSTSEGGFTQPKPLRPSVYILSNLSNPLTTILTASNDLAANGIQNNTLANIVGGTTITNAANFRGSNQENRITSSTCNNNTVYKKMVDTDGALITTIPSTTDLFPAATNANSGNIMNNNIHVVERDRSNARRGLPLVQSFGSPSRIVSIDLTS